jgi:uncharacterized protein
MGPSPAVYPVITPAWPPSSCIVHALLYVLAAVLITAGLVAAVLPILPGIPLIFGGIWLIAGVDGYRHIGFWWLLGIAGVGAVGRLFDLLAGALGAKRVVASKQAVWVNRRAGNAPYH